MTPILWINTTLVHPNPDGGIYVMRFLTSPAQGDHPGFEGVCTVDVAGRTSRVYGMFGKFQRPHLRDMLKWLRQLGVVELRAHRAPGHILPRASTEGDWSVIDLLALEKRVKPGAPI